jgi:hypothetical protein
MANTYVLHVSALWAILRVPFESKGSDANHFRYARHILYFINYMCWLMYQLQEFARCECHKIRKSIVELWV